MSFLLPRKRRPRLSLVVIVHRMPPQAMRTLYSLSADYQRNVTPVDYEILVVENQSRETLNPERLRTLQGRIRYFLRDDQTRSPVNAINFGVEQAQSDRVCIMIDGARMVTPRLVATMLEAQSLSRNSIVSVPGYHLGSELQQKAVNKGYSERDDEALLERIGWPDNDGYRLFEIACFSGSCAGGFFRPYAESNCLNVSKALYEKVGGFDPAFNDFGGGMANLDAYKRLCEQPDTRLFVLPGEGSFHQFHGGVTTGQKKADRDPVMDRIKQQYRDLRGEDYKAPAVEASYYGDIPRPAMPFVALSLKKIGYTAD